MITLCHLFWCFEFSLLSYIHQLVDFSGCYNFIRWRGEHRWDKFDCSYWSTIRKQNIFMSSQSIRCQTKTTAIVIGNKWVKIETTEISTPLPRICWVWPSLFAWKFQFRFILFFYTFGFSLEISNNPPWGWVHVTGCQGHVTCCIYPLKGLVNPISNRHQHQKKDSRNNPLETILTKFKAFRNEKTHCLHCVKYLLNETKTKG